MKDRPESDFSVPRIGRAAPWLAPLAGHTNLAFRVLCREQGAAAACTEMVSAKGLIYGQRAGRKGETRRGSDSTLALLRTVFPERMRPAASAEEAAAIAALPAEADAPLVAQLFGDDPEFLGQAVELLRSWGFGWFDLNLGCSVPKVVKAGAGAALARSLPKTLEAARAMLRAAGPVTAGGATPGKNAGRVPAARVGFKLRLGWSAEEENYLELAQELEQCGAGWVTLHPRHARQGFGGSPDHAALEKLAGRLSIPLMASGDLFDAAAALRCLEQTGADGVMFARGALYNPAVFRDYHALLRNPAAEKRGAEPALLRALILRHAELARALAATENRPAKSGGASRPESSLLPMRGAIARYVKDLPGSRGFRSRLSACRDWPEFYALVNDFLGDAEKLAGRAGKTAGKA